MVKLHLECQCVITPKAVSGCIVQLYQISEVDILENLFNSLGGCVRNRI